MSADATYFQNWHWSAQFQSGSCSLTGLRMDASTPSQPNEFVDSGDHPLHCKIFPGHQQWDAVMAWDKSL